MLKFIPVTLALALVLATTGSAFADDTAPERGRRGSAHTQESTDDRRDSRRETTPRDARRDRERRVEDRGRTDGGRPDVRRDRDSHRDVRRDDRGHDRGHVSHRSRDRGHAHDRHRGRPPVRVVDRPVVVSRPPVKIVDRRPVKVVHRPAVKVVHRPTVKVVHRHVHGRHCDFVPGKWGYRLREVVEPGYHKIVHTEAVYELRWDSCRRTKIRVLVRPAERRRVWVPARTVTRRVRVWIPRHFTCGHHPGC